MLYIIFELNDALPIHLGVEKNNDDAKRNYYSSSRHDAAKEILHTEARLDQLRDSCYRSKRKYEKVDSSYWDDGIRAQRQRDSSQH